MLPHLEVRKTEISTSLELNESAPSKHDKLLNSKLYSQNSRQAWKEHNKDWFNNIMNYFKLTYHFSVVSR